MSGDVLKLIEEKMPSFSKGQRRIANYILEQYDKAAYITASKLSEIVGVSESTVVRFAIELGFEGYPDFQHAMQSLMRNRLTSFQRMEVSNQLMGEGNVLGKVLLSDAERIRRTLEITNSVSFDRAIEAIINADNIYILGVRSSSYLAGFLNYYLRMIFDRVRLLQSTSGSELFEQLLPLRKGDAVIAISFPRYSKSVIHGVEFAKGREANVIALTDSAQSPLAPLADQLLVAQSDMASFVDSLVAPISIINAMIVALSRRKQGELDRRLRELEDVWDRYDVYDKKST